MTQTITRALRSGLVFLGLYIGGTAIIVGLTMANVWDPNIAAAVIMPAIFAWILMPSKFKRLRPGVEPESRSDTIHTDVERMLKETEELITEGDGLMSEVASLDPDDRASLEWMMSLDQERRDFVIMCAEQGIKVTKDSLEESYRMYRERIEDGE